MMEVLNAYVGTDMGDVDRFVLKQGSTMVRAQARRCYERGAASENLVGFWHRNSCSTRHELSICGPRHSPSLKPSRQSNPGDFGQSHTVAMAHNVEKSTKYS